MLGFIVLMNLESYCQSNYQIFGTVVNDKNQGLDLALVTLMTPKDSVVKVTFTDHDGSFIFSNIKSGHYVINFSLLGYKPLQQNVETSGENLQINIGNFILPTNAKLLETVTISAKTLYVERKIDRLVVNVDALIANAGSNVLDALERAPGVSLDQNGNIKLKGRSGVTVFIDDKPTYLTGSDLENFLKSLPASSVKQIEIMTNPPAKYEAAGNSGVINIITKRNKTFGFQGNAVFSLQQGKYTRSNNSLNLNFNKKKVSLYANINGGLRNSFQDLNINRYYKNTENIRTSSFAQNSYIVKDGQSGNIKFGVDYYLSDKTTLGLSAKGLLSNSGDQTDNLAFIKNAQEKTIFKVLADNNTKNTFDNGTINLYLKQSIDTLGSTLTFDADYVLYKSGSEQLFQNFIFDPNVLTYSDTIKGNIPSDISIYAVKADYTMPINTNTKFDAGLKSAFTKTNNEAIYTHTVDGITTLDNRLSNNFKYDEWIHAGYLNFNKKFGNVDLQLGLRVETTTLKGQQLGNAMQPSSQFNRTYTNVFPTLFTSYQADSLGNHILSFSFGRRIDRPFFQDLNPFISPLDKFTYYSGNPRLLPTYSNNFSLTHTFKNRINTSFNYSLTTDGINETLEIKDGIYYSRPGNISTNHTYSLSIDGSEDINKWYVLNAYFELGYQIYKSALYTEQLNSSGTYFAANITNSFQLGKGWNVDVRGDYQSDIVYAQLLIKSFGTLNIAAQKKILKDKGSLKVSFGDILYTRRADGIINNLRNTKADWNSRLDTRSATLVFSYRFGKSTSNKPKHIGSGSESEQNRVKG